MNNVNLEGVFGGLERHIPLRMNSNLEWIGYLDKYFSSTENEYPLGKEILQAFLKQSATPEMLEDRTYIFITDFGISYSRRFGFVRCYDSSYTFVLAISEKSELKESPFLELLKKYLIRKKRFTTEYTPLASISFNFEDDTVLVKQIQGVKGRQKELSPLKWERMLLTLTCYWAKQYGYKRIKVRSAENNRWDKISDTGHGKLIYDVTAKRCGFKKEVLGDFIKNL